jgi:glycosyltransferase involved in cell wall biosynthesis
VVTVFRRKTPAKASAEPPPVVDEFRSIAAAEIAPAPPPPSTTRATLARTLAGATVLQILPALRPGVTARSVLDIAAALLRAGARSIIAGASGPLVAELTERGSEWIEFRSAHAGRLMLAHRARRLEDIIAAEHVDIVHAHGASAAAVALEAIAASPAWLVTSLPDGGEGLRRFGNPFEPLARGHRVVARSAFAAAPLAERYRIARHRLAIVPHSIDTQRYDLGAVAPDATAALRAAWLVGADEHVVLALGVVSPENGQIDLVDAARMMLSRGLHGVVFVVPGDTRGKRRHLRAVARRAKALGVEAMFRLGSAPADLPTMLGAADLVAVPSIVPLRSGALLAQAQAMGRPVLAAAGGIAPEMLLAPPRMPDELRTGWLTRPGDPVDLARALTAALTLPQVVRGTIAARARQFAEMTFSPASVAAAMLAVYTSLLESGS